MDRIIKGHVLDVNNPVNENRSLLERELGFTVVIKKGGGRQRNRVPNPTLLDFWMFWLGMWRN